MENFVPTQFFAIQKNFFLKPKNLFLNGRNLIFIKIIFIGAEFSENLVIVREFFSRNTSSKS